MLEIILTMFQTENLGLIEKLPQVVPIPTQYSPEEDIEFNTAKNILG